MPLFDCTAISCIRQVTGKKSYVNFLIESECRHAKSGACTFKKYIRKPQPATKEVGRFVVGPDSVRMVKTGKTLETASRGSLTMHENAVTDTMTRG